MFHDIDQNTDEWLDLRISKVTGSVISKIMANYGKTFGDPAKKLAITIARERVTGKRSLAEGYSNPHMQRGHEQEPIARMLYENENFVDVSNGGFFDNGRTGCSPDGLVLDNGVIEIKSVLDHVHYTNIKRGGVDPSYRWQIYFNLLETGREWIDFVSFCADFPPQTQLYTHRIYAAYSSDFFEKITTRLREFNKIVDESTIIIRG